MRGNTIMSNKNRRCREFCYSVCKSELYHHGIDGMHWGERNGPPYPLHKAISAKIRSKALQLSRDQKLAIRNIRNARTANLDKLGTSPDNNILFIAGYSGSGKSTTALGFKRSGDNVIHLDAYSEPETKDTLSIRNKRFDAFLDKHLPGWRRMPNAERVPDAELEIQDGRMKLYSKEYWDLIDNFRYTMEDFSRDEYRKGNRVIVEGVQLADDWLSGDRSYYNGKPIIVLGTNPIYSMNRAAVRDGAKNAVARLISLDDPMEFISWYRRTHGNLNNLAKVAGASRRNKSAKQAISRIGVE